jgi:hypothetical protein
MSPAQAPVGVRPRDDDPLLRMRMESIRTNLEQVRDAKKFVVGRRTEIQDLTRVFDAQEGIQEIARNFLMGQLEECLRWAHLIPVTEGNRRLVEKLCSLLQEIILDARTVAEQATNTANIILTMGTRWSAISGNSFDFDSHLEQTFQDQAQALIDKIERIDLGSPVDAWEQYRTQIRDQSDVLFSEYVEFLGGVALRDTGLGGLVPSPLHPDEAEYNRDVCHMADELIRQIYYIGSEGLWHSMAVPGRRHATAGTISRMIRLGFPEWTVWAVPLAAFEFGQVVVDVNHLVDNYPQPAGVSADDLRVALADAFATYVMGPSYALASILTRLEPAGAATPAPLGCAAAAQAGGADAPPGLTDGERAQVIFETLRLMDEDATYTGVLEKLREQWSNSLGHSGVAVDLLPESNDRVAGWTGYMQQVLKKSASRVIYRPSRWREAMDWQPLVQLANGLETNEWRLNPQSHDVRDLLSAAWYQRVTSDERSSRPLAVAALTLWRHDLAARTSRGVPTNRTV